MFHREKKYFAFKFKVTFVVIVKKKSHRIREKFEAKHYFTDETCLTGKFILAHFNSLIFQFYGKYFLYNSIGTGLCNGSNVDRE